jgi:hypothetical protein
MGNPFISWADDSETEWGRHGGRIATICVEDALILVLADSDRDHTKMDYSVLS